MIVIIIMIGRTNLGHEQPIIEEEEVIEVLGAMTITTIEIKVLKDKHLPGIVKMIGGEIIMSIGVVGVVEVDAEEIEVVEGADEEEEAGVEEEVDEIPIEAPTTINNGDGMVLVKETALVDVPRTMLPKLT